MKTKPSILAMAAAITLTSSTAMAVTDYFPTENGYVNPLSLSGSALNVASSATFLNPNYSAGSPARHLGTDIMVGSGSPVYSIAEGTVVRIYNPPSPSTVWDYCVIVQHRSADAGSFFAIYGHVVKSAGLTQGMNVARGTRIGTIGNLGGNSHLHFGINVSASVSSFWYGLYGWGRVPTSTSNQTVTNLGWRDALPWLRANGNRPAPPWGMNEPFVESSRVGVDWADVPNANAYRLQIARAGVTWTRENGFLPQDSPANSSVPVNAGIPIPADRSSYIWQSGSAYFPYGPPTPGQTYQWTVRVNVPGSGTSYYTSPRSFTVPAAVTAGISLSTSSLNASSSTGINAPSSSFTIRNSSGGVLNYSLGSNAWWLSLSPSTGSSIGESDLIQVNYNTAGLAAGSYAATITASAPGVSSSSITVNLFIAATTDDFGDSMGAAYRTFPGGLHYGSLERGGDVDMFVITLNGSTNSLRANTAGGTDTVGDILDSTGNVLATNDDANNTVNFDVSRDNLPAGTYFIRVRGYSAGTTGSYRLSITGTSNTTPSDDYGNTLGAAYRTYPGYSHSGNIEVSGDWDMFVITLNGSSNSLRVYTTGTTDTYGELLNSSGGMIAFNDDTDASLNFEVRATGLPAGTYYFKVRGYSTRTGAYQVYFSN